MDFDGAYTLTSGAPGGASGPLLGNGKIAVTLPPSGVGDADVLLVGPANKRSGGNAVPAASVSHVRLFADLAHMPPSASLESAHVVTLAMDAGIATTTYAVGHGGTQWAEVSHDVYVHRALPYVIVQTLRVTFTEEYLADATAPEPTLVHAVTAHARVRDPAFGTSAVNLGPGRAPLLTFGCTGGLDGGGAVAVQTAYVHDPAHLHVRGHNLLRGDPGRGLNVLAFNRGGLQAGVTYRLHFVSAAMTSGDFAEPREESLRMLVSLLAARLPVGSLPVDAVARLRAEHVEAWASAWRVNVTMVPRASATALAQADVRYLQRALRVALYNMLSCTRQGATSEFNPMSAAIVDRDGSIAFDGDLFLMPALAVLNPPLVRNVMTMRLRDIAAAQQLAAALGNAGAKFPYATDVLGYSQALYWDPIAPVAVFNTALVAINAWNYYRASTGDHDWLEAVGYPIMREAADYIASIARIQPDGEYVIPNATGPAARAADGNTFTDYLCATALKYAMEAAYALSRPAKPAWGEVYAGLQVDVLRLDPSDPASYPVAEPLVLMTPLYDAHFQDLYTPAGREIIEAALATHVPRIQGAYAAHPYNIIPAAMLHALLAQSQPSQEARQTMDDRFMAPLMAFVRACTSDDDWGNMSLTPDKSRNDLNLSGLLLAAVLAGPLGFRILGGVTDTRFFYQVLRIDHFDVAVLPSAWEQVIVSRVTGDGRCAAVAAIANTLE